MTLPGVTVSNTLLIAALAACLTSAGCASVAPGADGDGDGDPGERVSEFARTGPYLGLYALKSYEDFDTSSNNLRSGDSDLGAGAMVGYRATPNVAVELVVEDVKGFRVSNGAAKTDLDLLNVGVLGKYYLMTERVQPYVVAGGGLARSDVHKLDFDHDGGFLRGGLGADIYLTPELAVFGEANYNRMVGGVSDLDHIDLQLGLLLRF